MRIYVGNLSYSVTSEDLREVFGEYGEVASAEVVQDKFSGQSKGFGFVDLPDNSDADRAIKELNDQVYKGRKMTVNEAKPRAPRPQQRRY
jgi:RNA recognition motif-containing protein